MLALTRTYCGYILLQLLLFLPGILPSIPISLEREASRIKYLEYFLEDVILERPTDTLLILKRRQDNTCLLKEFNTHHLIPTLRLDESTIIRVKDLFNSEAIALVCMSELADSMLLTSLAKDLHRMRETRIIIWLQDNQPNPKKYLDVITDQARTYNFLSLIVLHSTSSNLLLFLPGILPSIPISLEREASRIKYLEYFLGDVIMERPTDTLLILKRRQDNTCLLKEFNTHHLIPTLRLDESTIIRVKDLFNSDAIALVCMSELSDSILLTSLAKDLHRMRETRIIIWLQDNQSNPKKYLDAITDQARTYNFLSLIVLHSTSSNVNDSIIGYRLYPFPKPYLVRIMDLKKHPIFPDFWKDFGNKTAVALPIFKQSHERIQMMFSQNPGDAHQIYTKLWAALNIFQRHYRSKILCDPPGLNVYGTYPVAILFKQNSVFIQAWNYFVPWVHDLGLNRHWTLVAIQKMVEFTNNVQSLQHPTPLNFDNLQPTDTLLILKRRQDNTCLLKEFNTHHLIPTLRFDESTIIRVKDLFNSEAIALVCMSELADSILLTSLAKDLHRMRETRIIIWLQDNQSNPKKYLDVITDQARTYNFLSLIVLHSNSSDFLVGKYSALVMSTEVLNIIS
ncbi:hypothetical protein ACLKA6_016597 [Drosophila palustris]